MTDVKDTRGMTLVTPPIALTTAPPEPVPPALTPNLGLQLARPMSKPTWMGTFNGNMCIIDDYISDEIMFKESIEEKIRDIDQDISDLNLSVSDNLSQINTKVNTIEDKITEMPKLIPMSVSAIGGVNFLAPSANSYIGSHQYISVLKGVYTPSNITFSDLILQKDYFYIAYRVVANAILDNNVGLVKFYVRLTGISEDGNDFLYAYQTFEPVSQRNSHFCRIIPIGSPNKEKYIKYNIDVSMNVIIPSSGNIEFQFWACQY